MNSDRLSLNRIYLLIVIHFEIETEVEMISSLRARRQAHGLNHCSSVTPELLMCKAFEPGEFFHLFFWPIIHAHTSTVS